MKKILGLVLFLFIIIPHVSFAQVYCTGSSCNNLPINYNQLNNIFISLQSNYLNPLMRDMTNANVIAAMNIIPSTSVNLEEFTIGANVTLASTKTRKIDVQVPDYGVLEDVPSVGISIVPGAFIASNLGYIFSGSTSLEEIPFYSLYRFDVYLGYLQSGLNDENVSTKKKENESWNVSSNMKALELRYHLVEGEKDLGLFYKFLGVSSGIGYYNINQKIQYYLLKKNIQLVSYYGSNLIWQGNNEFTIKNLSDVYTLDIKTGVQLFYLFRFSLGVGNAWVKGNSNLTLHLYGPMVLAGDLSVLLGLQAPDAIVGMFISGEGSPRHRSYAYYTAGLELNIPIFKVFLNVKATSEVSSSSFGIRIAL